MIRFKSDNIVIGEIKQLLQSFNLPKAIVLKDQTRYIGNKIYIQGNVVYRSSMDGSKLEVVDGLSYEWGDKLPNITHTLPITSNIYDVTTHRYLGNYLRFLRDYKKINLMSMYNCFTEESPGKLDYTFYNPSTIKHVFDVSDGSYRIYMVPIKLGQLYTISLNTTNPIELVAGYYAHNKVIKMFPESFHWQRSCLSTDVFLYDKAVNLDTYDGFLEEYYQQDENLYLFIKLPSTYQSSIIVLEGDYRKNTNVFINNHGYTEIEYVTSACEKLGSGEVVYDYNETPSRLQLLSCRGDYSYAFADKLLEYIFLSVVLPGDEIVNNIKDLQKKLFDLGYLPVIKRYGVWTEDVTAACRLCSHDNLKHREVHKDYDFIGFMDSDIENELGGIQ